MSYAKIWVHRLHERYPGIGYGMRLVEEQTAKDLIAEECAQDWQTDARRLIPHGGSLPKAAAPPPVESKTKPRPRRTYKRRDIKPEE